MAFAETYLSGFCSGGATWAHERCPAAWKDKPCRCVCHQEPEPEPEPPVERPRPNVDLELE